jgi:pteridine reductase
VAVHYRTSANDAAEAVDDLAGRGVDAEAFQADLTDESSVRRLVQSARACFGRLDLLVNCAAIYAPIPLEKVTADDVRRNFEVNLLGTFLCSQQAGLAMVEQPEGGLIVNIADWALARPYLNYAAYFASKGGIPDLTRCLAVELGTRNPHVRVNCILPGPVLFPPDMPQAECDQAIASTLVKRAGEPENIASTVGFFVDNDFVTGVCLPIDGGRTIFAAGS